MKIKQDRERYNIGRNIREYRKACNLTQNQVMAKMQLLGICISRGSYSHIECGIANVHVKELLALAAILHVGMEDFFKGMRLDGNLD